MIIYHYCSLPVFKEIIVNKRLRFTDITQSNDSRELSWIAEFIEPAILSIRPDLFKSEKFKTDLDYAIRSVWGSLLRGNEVFSESLIRRFVCCFSGERDSLSQWRGYADDGRGICIGFDDTVFSSRQTGLPACYKYDRVKYEPDEHIEMIQNTLFSELRCMALDEILCVDFNLGSLFYHSGLMEESIFHKNSAFKDEKERRVVLDWYGTSSDYQDVHGGYRFLPFEYTATSTNLKCYTDFCFKDMERQEPFIKEVIIGPNAKITINEMCNFLSDNGLDYFRLNNNNGVVRSSATYISW